MLAIVLKMLSDPYSTLDNGMIVWVCVLEWMHSPHNALQGILASDPVSLDYPNC